MAPISILPPEILSTIFARSGVTLALARLCLVNKAFNEVAHALLYRDMTILLPHDYDPNGKALREPIHQLANAIAKRSENEGDSPLTTTQKLSILGSYGPAPVKDASLIIEELRTSYERLVSTLRPVELELRLDDAVFRLSIGQGLFDAVTSLTVHVGWYHSGISIPYLLGPDAWIDLSRLTSLTVHLGPYWKREAVASPGTWIYETNLLQLEHLALYTVKPLSFLQSVGFHADFLTTSQLPKLRTLIMDGDFGFAPDEPGHDVIVHILEHLGPRLTGLGLVGPLLLRRPELFEHCPNLANLRIVSDAQMNQTLGAILVTAPVGIRRLALALSVRPVPVGYMHTLRDQALLPHLEVLEIIGQTAWMYAGTTVEDVAKERGLKLVFKDKTTW